MSDFDEIMTQDLRSVFLNEQEFGERIDVDGEEMTAVIDQVDFDPLLRSDPRPGLDMETVRLYIMRDDLAGRYSIEQRVKYAGDTWHVLDVKEHKGLVVLDLYQESV